MHLKMVYLKLALMGSLWGWSKPGKPLECIFDLASAEKDPVHMVQINSLCRTNWETWFRHVLVIQTKSVDSAIADFSNCLRDD